ncbi:hypothetical protein J2W30_003332 [Variovorax boronicumulans]|uniref:hypothetical protein n=1 Tax=Variovorax TaxID=34072 RepID=UPI002785EAF0|nr:MULTISPECIES: hypothetical protein [Variovorax]MDQ0035564.1 hypothetical protein [Variovorax boronicumulans]MDQ0607896.1 hypothetical protein [Variovorax sp. W1I1]
MPDTPPHEDSRLIPCTPGAPPAPSRAVGMRQSTVEWALSNWSAPAHALRPLRPGPAQAPQLPTEDFDRLIGAAVHDVRNSLSAIRLGIELLARRGDRQQPDAVLAHVDHAADRAIERSEELADVCRIAAGKDLVIATQRFSLHEVVRQAIDAAEAPFAASTVFEHDRLGDGDCRGDPARIAQFLNLAFEELAGSGLPARVIVVSEVAGDLFRVAVCAGGASPESHGSDRPDTALSSVRRRLLLHGIARAHGGRAEFGGAPDGRPSIAGTFRGVRRGPPAGY